MNLNPSTLLAVVRDLVKSVEQAGIRKLLLLNSHGGNDFKPLLRELMPETGVQLFLCDWFRGISADVQRAEFADPGDHAGAVETALGLACFEHLVVRDPQTGELAADEVQVVGAVAVRVCDAAVPAGQAQVPVEHPGGLPLELLVVVGADGRGRRHPAWLARRRPAHQAQRPAYDSPCRRSSQGRPNL